jgi:hypothetical protein
MSEEAPQQKTTKRRRHVRGHYRLTPRSLKRLEAALAKIPAVDLEFIALGLRRGVKPPRCNIVRKASSRKYIYYTRTEIGLQGLYLGELEHVRRYLLGGPSQVNPNQEELPL